MSKSIDFSTETASNWQEKTLCVLLVDTSGSMEADNAIGQLNSGLQNFHSEIAGDSSLSQQLELAVVEFNSTVELIAGPGLTTEFSMPRLRTAGTTQMVSAIRKAIEIVEERKKWYKSTQQTYKRPWIVLITDGAPDPGEDVNGVANEIEQATKAKKFAFLPIGVQGADMTILSLISGFIQDDSTKQWTKMKPLPLDGTKFVEFFRWLSRSMETVAGSHDGEKIALPAANDWMAGFTL
jgi:uncharacterized protein YegL